MSTPHEKAIATYNALKKRREKRNRRKEFDISDFKYERVTATKKSKRGRRIDYESV